ncbi:PQQ-dependent sugar dehydrogenase [Endobacterium cereale]|uniref:PQQ-dependent sugar dehydrogenase n=1 Tax=Endobacterium cereale TaxID=2663029 RepID=UPI001AD95094
MTSIRSKNVLRGLYRQSIRSAPRRSLLATLLLVSAVSAAPADRSASNTGNTASHSEPKVIASGLEIPWSIVFVGDEVLVSQRDTADIISLKPGAPARSIGKVPDVTPRLDGGLLGLAVLNSDDRTWIYAYHGTASVSRIVRMTYANGALGARGRSWWDPGRTRA